jgi:hypothetical protein
MMESDKPRTSLSEERKTDYLSIDPEITVAEETVPRSYWYSPGFLGSCLAIILLGNNLFIGYAMPVSISTDGRIQR